MARFWIDKSCLKHNEFTIKGQLYHHICHVCQIKKGETFELLCEGRQKYKVVLSSVSAFKAKASIIQVYPIPPFKKPYLHLALSIPRLSKMDSLIEKSVELGVKEFHPFVSTFSFLKKTEKLSMERQKRWQKISEHSMATSRRSTTLIIHPLRYLHEIKITKDDLALMAYEGLDSTANLPQLIKKQDKPNAVWLFVGSEGGFSPQEAQDFASKDRAFLFSFGEQILRVETACLFGLSLLKYHYHFKGSSSV